MVIVSLLNLLIGLGGGAIALSLTVGIPLWGVHRHKKTQAIRDYVRRLGRVLRARYGIQTRYSPAQVQQMIKKWGYSPAYEGYGLALYCSPEDFEAFYSAQAAPYDYEMTRQEIQRFVPLITESCTAADVIELGDRLNEKGRAQRFNPDSIEDASDLDDVSAAIKSNKGKDYVDIFEETGGGTGRGGGWYSGGFGGDL